MSFQFLQVQPARQAMLHRILLIYQRNKRFCFGNLEVVKLKTSDFRRKVRSIEGIRTTTKYGWNEMRNTQNNKKRKISFYSFLSSISSQLFN